MSLEKYGLEAFGIDATDEINTKLVIAINKNFQDQEKGAVKLGFILEELYQKAEALTDEKSVKFKMFTEIDLDGTKEQAKLLTKDIFHILEDAGWHYDLVLDENSLTKK